MSATRPSLSLQLLALAMAALAATALDDSLEGGLGPPALAGRLLLHLSLAGAGFCASTLLARRSAKPAWPRSWMHQTLLGLLFLLPLLLEPFTHATASTHYPEGSLLLWGVRNVGLGAAAISRREGAMRLSAFASSGQVIFAFTLGGAAAAPGLTGAYLLLSVLWLVGVAAARRGENLGGRSQHRLGAGISAAVVLTAFAAAHAHRGTDVGSLEGWFPSSGGSRERRMDARGGVNDGEDQVAALDRAETVGFTNSDVFIDTPEDTLFDVSNDIVGEPRRRRIPKKAAVVGTDRVIEARNQTPKSLAPSREFSTLRQTPRQRRTPEAQLASALYYIRGRTPAHLGITAYDRFDGIGWHVAPLCQDDLSLMKRWGSCWFDILIPSPIRALRGEEHYEVRVARRGSTRIPTPAHLTGFQIRTVDRADMFRWSHDGLLAMDVHAIPSGTSVSLCANLADEKRLGGLSFWSGALNYQRYLEIPSGLHYSYRLGRLAEEIARSAPVGWPRIKATTQMVRARCRLDALYRPPADCEDPVQDFLFVSRRGPSYMFASATALLLRELGYPTRLVSGFYADPKRFDEKSGMTLVSAQDLHFWPQVMFEPMPGAGGSRAWLNVEPTPGRTLLQPRPSFQERFLVLAGALRNGLLRFWPGLVLGAMLLAAAWRFRLTLADAGLMLAYRLSIRGSTQQRVLGALWVIDCRCRLLGKKRPPNFTLRSWLQQLDGARAAGPAEHLLDCGDRLMYGHKTETNAEIEDSKATTEMCDEALAALSIANLRAPLSGPLHRRSLAAALTRGRLLVRGTV